MARQIIDLPKQNGGDLSDDDLLILRDMVSKKDKKLALEDLANFVLGKLETDKILEIENKNDIPTGSYYVKKVAGGKYNLVKIDEYPIGQFLVLTQNSAELQWNGQNKTIWSGGTWTQKGLLKKTDKPWVLSITAPNDENWVVKLHHITSTVHNASSSWSMSGIALMNDNASSMTSYLTECLVANGDLYLHQETETYVEIPAGTTKNFCIYVRTQNGQSRWAGGGPTTNNADSFWFGYSCMFDAILVDKEKV